MKYHSYATRLFPLSLNTGVASCLVIMEIDLLYISYASISTLLHILKNQSSYGSRKRLDPFSKIGQRLPSLPNFKRQVSFVHKVTPLSGMAQRKCDRNLEQCFSTFVRPRPGKFFFKRRRPGPNKFTRKYHSIFFKFLH